ncbi:hypothetical protein ACTJI8_04875 [Microbacterium sp. 22303]|uniref:hypothetical protein n=1 Tax=Microbacterium sp. 22303 TaxID=3453905 RepID=UPI003F86CE88
MSDKNYAVSGEHRPPFAFGSSRMTSLGSSGALIIGPNSPQHVEQYRSNDSWVGKSRHKR